MGEISNARQELEYLIAQRIRQATTDDVLTPEEIARAVMRLFSGGVNDEYSRIDVSAFGEGPGSNLLWSRSLVAVVPGRPVVMPKRVEDA